MSFNSITTDKPNTLDIEWVISNYCNFSCSYCTEDLFGNTSRALDLDTAVTFFNTVHEHNPEPKMLSLSGGEPTMWKHLPEFVDRVADKYFFQIVTNGSRTLDWWKRFVYNRSIDRITMSVHTEFVNYDKTYDNIDFLQEHTDLTILLLFKPGCISELETFANKLVDNNIKCVIQIKPLTSHDSRKVYEYTDEEKKYIRDFKYDNATKDHDSQIAKRLIIDGKEHNLSTTFKLIADGLNKFTGWKCNLGKTRMFIWHDGNVFPATCNTGMKRPIGNVFENRLETYSGSTICKDSFCHCGPDIKITKNK
jgi:sulfatase maturation enzyme AslB (radical SAM superfamily)